jgi:TPR repeat protein
LGACYLDGRGIAQDKKEALKWFRKAADQGLPEAQYELGQLYQSGETVEKDRIESLKWYVLAANQKHPKAAKAAKELRKTLSPSQITEAEKRAKSFTPPPGP